MRRDSELERGVRKNQCDWGKTAEDEHDSDGDGSAAPVSADTLLPADTASLIVSVLR